MLPKTISVSAVQINYAFYTPFVGMIAIQHFQQVLLIVHEYPGIPFCHPTAQREYK